VTIFILAVAALAPHSVAICEQKTDNKVTTGRQQQQQQQQLATTSQAKQKKQAKPGREEREVEGGGCEMPRPNKAAS